MLSRQAPPAFQSSQQRANELAKLTFRAGSSALKALEQTHLLSDGLVYREEVDEETNERLLELDDN